MLAVDCRLTNVGNTSIDINDITLDYWLNGPAETTASVDQFRLVCSDTTLGKRMLTVLAAADITDMRDCTQSGMGTCVFTLCADSTVSGMSARVTEVSHMRRTDTQLLAAVERFCHMCLVTHVSACLTKFLPLN